MDLGQKLRQARLAAGLSQRQLCGDEITRNMLSQIENGSACPSMDTLRYLARQLGKPISYFLEDEAVTSPNQALMERARTAFGEKDYATALTTLDTYQKFDPVFDWERHLLVALSCMELAEQAICAHRLPYAAQLLEQAADTGSKTPYYNAAMERQRLILLAECSNQPIPLPSDDRALLLRARAALAQDDPSRAEQYLDAAEDHSTPEWNLLRGHACIELGDLPQALPCLKAAEEQYPKEAIPQLEHCCRELEDYKEAYFYACKLRELER